MRRIRALAALFAVVMAGSAMAAQAPSVSYTRAFPGSQPPYFSVSVSATGALEYKESPNDPQPVTAQLEAAETSAILELAAKLDYFRQPLESGLKVANTGKKTLRYVDADGKASEAVFNYSLNPDAQALIQTFESIAESEAAYLDLERTSRFDKIGVNDALAEVESLWLRKELAAPLQFVPLLNHVASHEEYMHIARDRAARLRDEFQAAASASATAVKPGESQE